MTDPAEKYFHVKISLPKPLRDPELERAIHEFEQTGITIHTEREGPTAWAALEWVVPGLVAVWVFKSYFDGFLKEAGKDHYQIFKAGLKKIVNHTRNYRAKTMVSSGSNEKVEGENSQSKAISVYLQTSDDRIIKLLFDLKLDDQTWSDALEQILSEVEKGYLGKDNFVTNATAVLKGKYLYAFIDPITREWRIIDSSGLGNDLTKKIV